MATVIDKSWYKRPEGVKAHESAGGVIARVEEGRVLLAFITEKGNGTCVLPKGHVEPGETDEEAAVREIEEEAGLSDLNLVKYLGAKERLSFNKRAWKRTHYFLYTTEQVEGVPTDPAVFGETVWFPLDELPEIFWPEQRALIEENRQELEQLAR